MVACLRDIVLHVSLLLVGHSAQAALQLPRRVALSHAAATAVLTGVMPVRAAGPLDGLTVSITEHGLPVEQLLAADHQQRGAERPARVIYCQTSRETALSLAFYSEASLATIRQLEGECLHAHYMQPTNFRVPDKVSVGRYVDVLPGPGALSWSGALRAGSGIMVGAHGLTVGHSMWLAKFTSELSDGEHASYHVGRSIAGTLLAGSTDAPIPGPLVVHVTSSEQDAQVLRRQLDPTVDPRVQQALQLGIMRSPIYAVSARVVKDVLL